MKDFILNLKENIFCTEKVLCLSKEHLYADTQLLRIKLLKICFSLILHLIWNNLLLLLLIYYML